MPTLLASHARLYGHVKPMHSVLQVNTVKIKVWILNVDLCGCPRPSCKVILIGDKPILKLWLLAHKEHLIEEDLELGDSKTCNCYGQSIKEENHDSSDLGQNNRSNTHPTASFHNRALFDGLSDLLRGVARHTAPRNFWRKHWCVLSWWKVVKVFSLSLGHKLAFAE